MKKIYLFKMFLMAFVLMLLGGVNASAEESPVYTLDFTTKSVKSSTYTDDWTYTSNTIGWTINGAANNNGGWAYVRTGGKKGVSSSYYKSESSISGEISKIVLTALNTASNSAFKMKKITLTVASDAGFANILDEVSSTSISTSMTFTPSSDKKWKDAYYKFTFDWSNTSTSTSKNYGMDIQKLDFYQPADAKNFKYSAIEYNAVLGGTNTFPTLTNDYDTEVTYNSSNTSVATIGKEGNITLVGVGTTTITATLKADNKITASYTLNVEKLTNSITFSNGTNTYVKAPVSVELSASVAGSTIYYSTDGNKPPKDDAHKYSSAINITKSGTVLKVLATAVGIDDAEAEAKYTIKPAQPVFSEESKTFKEPLNVTLSLPETPDNTSKIYYAIGKNATAESTLYDGSPITIDAPNDGDKVILHAVVDEYGNVGTEKRCTYTKTTAVIFDFTANPWGIVPTEDNTKSNTDGRKDLIVEGVTLTTSSSSSPNTTKTCIYGTTSGELRVYTGGALKFEAPEDYTISKIVFTGTVYLAPNVGKLDSKVWTTTDGVNSVVFTRKDDTSKIQTVAITLVPSVENKTLVATDKEAYYSTFSCDRDVVFTEDVKVYAVNVIDGKLKLAELTKGDYKTTNSTTAIVKNGYYVPANTGVLISATKQDIKYYTAATSQDHASLPNNQLVAATADGMFTSDSDHKYYKLAYDDYEKKTGLGFYYGAAGGAAFEVKKGLAYLAVPVSVSGSNLAAGYSFGGNGGDDTTGINGIENDNVNETQTIFNLQGQRVEKAGLRGIYIVNGKKVVLK